MVPLALDLGMQKSCVLDAKDLVVEAVRAVISTGDGVNLAVLIAVGRTTTAKEAHATPILGVVKTERRLAAAAQQAKRETLRPKTPSGLPKRATIAGTSITKAAREAAAVGRAAHQI